MGRASPTLFLFLFPLQTVPNTSMPVKAHCNIPWIESLLNFWFVRSMIKSLDFCFYLFDFWGMILTSSSHSHSGSALFTVHFSPIRVQHNIQLRQECDAFLVAVECEAVCHVVYGDHGSKSTPIQADKFEQPRTPHQWEDRIECGRRKRDKSQIRSNSVKQNKLLV